MSAQFMSDNAIYPIFLVTVVLELFDVSLTDHTNHSNNSSALDVASDVFAVLIISFVHAPPIMDVLLLHS